MTRHQRATVYFKAVRFVKSFLVAVGFREEADVGHSGFSISMDNFCLEMMVKEAPNMAHVTSFEGYEYDPKKINAKVTFMSPGGPGEYVIQIITTLPNGMTQMPTYATVSPESGDVLREAFINCLMTARDQMRKCPQIMAKIQAALAKRDIEAELRRMEAEDDTKALPPSQG